ncbi:MAG: tetratricopeptide repeat protein, partial [Cyclobacteriaceae bacterium]|nr:tetratricopeptide repeat protein [Cyclobacteriaceae bacterium]
WFAKAIKTDSSFISSYVTLSFTYRIMGNDTVAKKWCNIANKKRDELPLKGKLMLDHLHAYYYETPNEQIIYLKQFLEIDELNTTYWFLLGSTYYRMSQYRDAIINFEKALEIHKKWGASFRNPFIYHRLGELYHKTDAHKREKEVYKLGLSIFPDHPNIIANQAICALSQGDKDQANGYISNYKSIRKNKSRWSESRILSGLGYIYTEANLFYEAEINYRKALKLEPGNPDRLNGLAWFLINNDINVNEGVDLIQKGVEIRQDDWYSLDTKGWGLYKQGKYEEALKVLTEAWDLRPAYDHEGYQHILEVEEALAILVLIFFNVTYGEWENLPVRQAGISDLQAKT